MPPHSPRACPPLCSVASAPAAAPRRPQVTAASDELGQVGSTFLHMKLVVDKGRGEREDVFMELTLPQFYEFMADMEKAKTYTDFLSS